MDTILELNKAFKDYIYNDYNHIYKHKPTNRNLKSVTQFLKSITHAFNTEFWSVLKAFEYSGYTFKQKNPKENCFILSDNTVIYPGFTDLSIFNLSYPVEKVKHLWLIKNILGTCRGSHLHNYLEQTERRDYTDRDYTKDCTQAELNLIDVAKTIPLIQNEYDKLGISIIESFNNIKIAGDKFVSESDFLIPVASEYIVGDTDIGLCGTFDRLYYNTSSGEYEIWDFKTDIEIKYSNKYSKFKLFDLDDCEFEKYSLQTSLYKLMIEKNTPITLGESYVTHFNWRTCNYEIIKVNDYSNLLKQEIQNGNNWSTYL